MRDELVSVLPSRFLRPQARLLTRGVSASDRLYTALNQVVAAGLILLLSPVRAVIALLLWRSDGAPLTFGHLRVGRHGRMFRCLKFRTMVRDADQRLADLLARDPQARAEWAETQKLQHDPRITPIGRFLRLSSLDELPQLFNVLRGEMHLVGPRPVGADPNLSHRADRILSQGWRPVLS